MAQILRLFMLTTSYTNILYENIVPNNYALNTSITKYLKMNNNEMMSDERFSKQLMVEGCDDSNRKKEGGKLTLVDEKTMWKKPTAWKRWRQS